MTNTFKFNLIHSFLDVSFGNVVPFFSDLLVRWTLQSKERLPQLGCGKEELISMSLSELNINIINSSLCMCASYIGYIYIY